MVLFGTNYATTRCMAVVYRPVAGRSPKPKKIIPNTGKEKAESEYLKQLEDENLRLRIENAYLTELRRLRLEEEKPPKNRQE